MPSTYVFVEKKEKYRYFLVEKSALSRAMATIFKRETASEIFCLLSCTPISSERGSLFLIEFVCFVCVEVLRPSQPNGVMSSAVSLPNHTFTGQAKSSKRLTSIVHILSPETVLIE